VPLTRLAAIRDTVTTAAYLDCDCDYSTVSTSRSMSFRGPGQHKEPSKSKDPAPFNPEAEHVTHTRIGVWDLYEDKRHKTERIPSSSFLQKFDETLTSLPFFIRAVKTLAVLCYNTLMLYLISSLITSLLPATALYYSGQLLRVVQESIDTRSVDKAVLFRVLFCRMACAAMSRLGALGQNWASIRISSKIRSHYAEHILHAHVRLDVPTYGDPAVRGQLSSVVSSRTNVAWGGIKAVITIVSTAVQLVTQLSVLIGVLKGQPDGTLLALMSFAEPVLMWIRRPSNLFDGGVPHSPWFTRLRWSDEYLFLGQSGQPPVVMKTIYACKGLRTLWTTKITAKSW
jgi:hypothetical protein